MNISIRKEHHTIIAGTAENDEISNISEGQQITIDAGAGDDFILNWNRYVTISGGAGNDSIENTGQKNVSIDGGAGNDSIFTGTYSSNKRSCLITIKGGTGDDSIFNGGYKSSRYSQDRYQYYGGDSVLIDSSAGDDYIYNYYGYSVTICSGAGNDYIDNYGGSNLTINAGFGDDHIFNDGRYGGGKLVTIDSGDGNDRILNYGDSVTIDAGVGDDSIFNGEGYYGVLGKSVSINAGEGNDYIQNSENDVIIKTGLGNDTIDCYEYSNRDKCYYYNPQFTLEVGSYTSITSGDDILLTTKNGSVLIKNGTKQKNMTIISQNDDTQISGSDSVENTLDNQTIRGTSGDDKLFNEGGNQVYIYGLEGNDEIGNNYAIKNVNGVARVYFGENVSLNGETGEDKIYSCSPKDHIIYAAGDGNDTIFTYHSSKDYSNGDSLKIHLTSGKFKGAKIDSRRRSDVILSLGNGTVVLKTGEGLSASKIPITVIDSSGKEFKFTGEYEVKTFAYKINAGETHTAVNHNDCSGELVTSKNGDAFIEQGDTIKTDSSGNITEILISDKNHRITTPLNRSTQKNVIVKDPAGNTIAKIKYGITEIYWNGTGYVIEAVDKDVPLSVESDMDNVSIIGSNKADNITTNGKNAVIYSNLGNDSIISNGTGATIVGGKDDDTISGTVDTLNLVSGKIKNASLKGSDLIISIGSSFIREDNSHTITIKNAKDKSVNVVNSANKKISIKNSYAGDPKILSSDIEYLQTLFKATENNLYNTTAGYIQPVKPDSSKVENLKGKFLANFKNDLTAINGDIKSVPEDVFEQIATNIFTALESSKLDEYSPTDTRQWLSNVLKSISQLKLSEFTVKSGSDNYQVTLNNLIGAGSGTSSIVIKKNNKNFAELNWTDNPEHTTQVLDDYLKILAKLHENVWWNVITGLAKDIGGDTAVKYAEYAKSIITALIGGGADEVIDSIKGIVKSEFMEYISGDGQLKIEEFIKNEVPNGKGKYIVNAAKSFKSLKAKLEEIKSEFEDYVALIEAGRNNDPVAVYENFLSAYDKFVENETNVINNINGNTSFLDDVKNTWNDLVSNVRLSLTGTSLTGANSGVSAESQIIAVGKAVYVDEAGDIVDSDTSAVLSVKLEGDTFVYDALTDEDQKISIGTSKDKFNFAVNTFEGNDTITAGSSADVTINSGAGNDSIKNSSSNSEINGEAGNDIIINTGKNVTVNGGSGNDKIYGGNDSDKLYGDAGNDSLYGNSGNDTLTGGAGNDTFFYETGNDVIADYVAGNDKIKLVSSSITSSSLSGSNVVLKTSNGNITVQNAKNKKITVIDKNGKETSQIYPSVTPELTPTLPTGWKYGNTGKTNMTASVTSAANVDLTQSYGTNVATVDGSKITTGRTFTGNAKANSIKGGKSADKISGGNGKDTIFGGAGNDSIYGGTDNDKLQGDAGNDTLNGGSGNDTLTGGAGSDIFIYESGNDVITDYKAGEDKIKLNPSAITSSTVKGSDVILTTSNGTLTVKATKDKVITFTDNNGKNSEKIFFASTSYAPLATGLTYDAKRTVLTASNKFTGNTIDLGEYLGTVTKVNASAVSQALSITGNGENNSIKGGKGADTINGGNGKDTIFGGAGNDSIYGGTDNDKLQGDAGNDTLNGGSGNDTLIGGAGADVFIYEIGNDVITDYTAGQDSIKVNGIISKVEYSNKNVIFKIGSGSLTVNNSKGKNITVINNNQSQIYSKTFDLLYDNNFVTDEFSIDSITEVTETNYSIGEIEKATDNEQICSTIAAYSTEK